MKNNLLLFVSTVLTDETIFHRLVERLSADESNVVMEWKGEKKILIKGSKDFNESNYESHPFHPTFAWFNLLIDDKDQFALEILNV